MNTTYYMQLELNINEKLCNSFNLYFLSHDSFIDSMVKAWGLIFVVSNL